MELGPEGPLDNIHLLILPDSLSVRCQRHLLVMWLLYVHLGVLWLLASQRHASIAYLLLLLELLL